MIDTRVRIVFSGETLPGISVDAAKRNLAALFKLEHDKVDSLFNGCVVTLKRDLEQATAERYLAALEKAGVRAYPEQDMLSTLSLVETDDHAVVSPEPDDSAAPAMPTSMTCPKCEQAQPRHSECRHCGIIIERYLARQAKQPVLPSVSTGVAVDVAHALPHSDVMASSGETVLPSVPGITGLLHRFRHRVWPLLLLVLLTAAVLAWQA